MNSEYIAVIDQGEIGESGYHHAINHLIAFVAKFMAHMKFVKDLF